MRHMMHNKSPALHPQAFTNAALLRSIRTLQTQERTQDEDDGLERMLEEWRYRFDCAVQTEIDRRFGNDIIAR